MAVPNQKKTPSPSTINNLAGRIEGISLGSASGGAASSARSSPAAVSPSSSSSLQGEVMRISALKRKKDFRHMEKVKGRMVNIVEGLELHAGVFNTEEQKKIVDCIYDLQEKGRNKKLRARTYSEPRKWMRGKGRITMQFGCCYNYALDKDGNSPGIIRDEEVDPIPPLLKSMIKRMVSWGVLPSTCVPNSCIVNIYEKDDCIPPHIDHHDFVRPFCTVSFLAECNIVFGTELKVLGPGEFEGPVAIPLPLGSVLILKGNGADVAKHCVPAVPAARISITFRKMDDSKLPFRFIPDPELENLRPIALQPNRSPAQAASTSAAVGPNTLLVPQQRQQDSRLQSTREASLPQQRSWSGERIREQPSSVPFKFDDDFPPLGSNNSNGKATNRSRPLRQ